MKKHGTFARQLLASFGGLAAMVAGANDHWFRDSYTEPKKRTRGRTGKGTYGRSLIVHFAARDMARMQAKKRSKDYDAVSTLRKAA